MKHETVDMVSCQPLVNGYVQLSLKVYSNAQPGQFVVLNNHITTYVMPNDNGIEMILPDANVFSQKTIPISPLQGEPLLKPELNTFHLVTVHDNGINACIAWLKKYRTSFQGLILIGTQTEFPFLPCPSRQLIAGMPKESIAALPLLEDWEVPHRLCSLKEMPGVFYGLGSELAQIWLENTSITPIVKIDIPAKVI